MLGSRHLPSLASDHRTGLPNHHKRALSLVRIASKSQPLSFLGAAGFRWGEQRWQDRKREKCMHSREQFTICCVCLCVSVCVLYLPLCGQERYQGGGEGGELEGGNDGRERQGWHWGEHGACSSAWPRTRSGGARPKTESQQQNGRSEWPGTPSDLTLMSRCGGGRGQALPLL